MAMFDWIRRRLSGEALSTKFISDQEDRLAGLGLRDTLDAHAAWKSRLKAILDGTSSEQVDVGTVSQDTVCKLGQWLYGDGRRLYGKLAEYEEVRKFHARFHFCAGSVLMQHNAGHADAALRELNGAFSLESDRVQLGLVRLYSTAKAR
jgi:Chemoreceptor zinc-binding domain